MSLTEQQYEEQRPDLLESKHVSTIDQIKKLQDLEKYMFQNIEETTDVAKNTEVVSRINELSSMRIIHNNN